MYVTHTERPRISAGNRVVPRDFRPRPFQGRGLFADDKDCVQQTVQCERPCLHEPGADSGKE